MVFSLDSFVFVFKIIDIRFAPPWRQVSPPNIRLSSLRAWENMILAWHQLLGNSFPPSLAERWTENVLEELVLEEYNANSFSIIEAYLGVFQTFLMELYAKIFSGFQTITIFTKKLHHRYFKVSKICLWFTK